MKLPPPEVLASFPLPNYTNPETRGNSLIIVNAVFLALATVVVVLRIFTRLVVRRWFGWDDIFIVCAFLCTIGLNTAVDIGSTNYGWNRHIYDIPFDVIPQSLKLAYWAKLIFLNASFFTMLSLLAFYYRLISEGGSSSFRKVLHAATIFNICAWLPFFIGQIFLCYPIHEYWAFPQSSDAKCIPEGPVTFGGGIVKTIVDFLITTLPIPLVLRMHMEKRQRYGVAVLLGLGYLATAAGVVRTYFTYKVFYASPDETWYEYPAFMAAAVENDIAVFCACIPTLRPLWPHLFGGPVGKLTSRLRYWPPSKDSSPGISSSKSKTGATPNPPPRIWPSIPPKVWPAVRANEHFGVLHSPSSSDENFKLVIQRHESFTMEEIYVHDREKGKTYGARMPEYTRYNAL